MEKQKKVIDASVAFKWFDKKEENSDKTLSILKKHLLGEYNLIVPELIFLEIINALKFKSKNEKAILVPIHLGINL